MREEIKQQLVNNADKFWANMNELKPKDYCEIYLKMMPYGFARAPEVGLTDSERGKLILEETKRKATIIGAGLPQVEDAIPEESSDD